MMTPGRRARELVVAANADFQRGDYDQVVRGLTKAFGLKGAVERYAASDWVQNHHDFTKALLDMAILWYMLGDFTQGDPCRIHAQAWADDPCCSSSVNFARSMQIEKRRFWYYVAGLLQRTTGCAWPLTV